MYILWYQIYMACHFSVQVFLDETCFSCCYTAEHNELIMLEVSLRELGSWHSYISSSGTYTGIHCYTAKIDVIGRIGSGKKRAIKVRKEKMHSIRGGENQAPEHKQKNCTEMERIGEEKNESAM